VTDPEVHGLKRSLGFWSAATIIIGTTIGSGIFLVSSDMIRAVGSPTMVLFVWLFGGVLTLMGALSYAELAAAMPASGGEYVYLRKAYGPVYGFLYGWTIACVGKPASIAALAMAFIAYIGAFVPRLDQVLIHFDVPVGPGGGPFEIQLGQIVAMGVIMLLAAINYVSVRAGGRVQVVGTALKTAAIATIIAVGLFARGVAGGNFQTTVLPDPGGIAGLFAALVAALFAYDGWTNAPMIGAEIERPERNLPRALILGTVAVAIIYMVINLAYFRVLSAGEVAASARVAADAMRKILSESGASLVTVAAMISIFSSLNGVILSGARIPFAMARDGIFFQKTAAIHPKFHTPGASLIAMSLWSCVVLLSGHFQELARLVVFTSWLAYAFTAASLIVLRWKHPELRRPYRVIGYPFVPAAFVLVALALLYSTLVTYPRESGLGLVLIIAGLPFYFYWIRRAGAIAPRAGGS